MKYFKCMDFFYDTMKGTVNLMRGARCKSMMMELVEFVELAWRKRVDSKIFPCIVMWFQYDTNTIRFFQIPFNNFQKKDNFSLNLFDFLWIFFQPQFEGRAQSLRGRRFSEIISTSSKRRASRTRWIPVNPGDPIHSMPIPGPSQQSVWEDNFVITYELLDEMMDNGYPQTTEAWNWTVVLELTTIKG